MDSSIGSTTKAETLFVKGSAQKFGLSVLLPEGSVFEQLLSGICWVPELERSACYRWESQIVWFFRPLDILDWISSRRNLNNLFSSVDVINCHHVIVALINASNVSLARTETQSADSLGGTSKTKLTDALHAIGVPNMNRRLSSALCGRNDVSITSRCDTKVSDVILMSNPVALVLLLHLSLLCASKESLLPGREILNDSKSGSHEHDLVVGLTEVEAGFVSCSSETINMMWHVCVINLWIGHLGVWRDGLVDTFEEMLLLSGRDSLSFLLLVFSLHIFRSFI